MIDRPHVLQSLLTGIYSTYEDCCTGYEYNPPSSIYVNVYLLAHIFILLLIIR